MRASSSALALYRDCQKGTESEADSGCQPSPMSPETGELNKPSEMSLQVAEKGQVNEGYDDRSDEGNTPKTCPVT